MLILTVVNPYGWDYVPYLWHALLLDRPLVEEWAPLWAAAGGTPSCRRATILLDPERRC
jgi:hypothetical protein